MSQGSRTTDDGCCGGGVGPVPYPGCTDCPRRPQTTIEWRLSVFAPDSEREIAFLLLTEEQAQALGAVADGALRKVEAYVGAWQK